MVFCLLRLMGTEASLIVEDKLPWFLHRFLSGLRYFIGVTLVLVAGVLAIPVHAYSISACWASAAQQNPRPFSYWFLDKTNITWHNRFSYNMVKLQPKMQSSDLRPNCFFWQYFRNCAATERAATFLLQNFPLFHGFLYWYWATQFPPCSTNQVTGW